MGNADTGTDVQMIPWADRTVTITGTFGGATIVIEGSENGTDYVTLSDNLGNALSLTAAASKLIAQNPKFVRPRTSGGTGTVLLVVIEGVKKL
jgi:hypothetical protein